MTQAITPTKKYTIDYVKHIVECNCVLPMFYQQLQQGLRVFYRFPVFSEIYNDGSIKPSFAECDHCGAILKVVEVGQVERTKKEETQFISTKEELQQNLPEKLIELLSAFKLPLITWQEVEFLMRKKIYQRNVILTKEENDGVIVGKHLSIKSETIWRIEKFRFGDDDDDDQGLEYGQ